MTDGPSLSPSEGAEALLALMSQIAEAGGAGDLGRLDKLIDQMEDVVALTGAVVPGMTAQIEALKGQTAKARSHFANTEAALWAGDFARADSLASKGPDLGYAASLDLVALDPIGTEFDVEDPEFNLTDFAANFGLKLDEADPSAPYDAFAELARGVPGAAEDLIDSGAELNRASGANRHTALLAALDAPARTAQVLERLIAAGADPLVIHAEGDNALSWAVGYDHPGSVTDESEAAIIQCLVAHGVDVNHIVAGQLTVLQRAILQADVPHVSTLLGAGADQSVDLTKDFQPEKLAYGTSIMLAAAKPSVLQVLLDFGGDARRTDKLGRTALEFVRSEAKAARNRVELSDEWTLDHAEALEISLGILERHLS